MSERKEDNVRTDESMKKKSHTRRIQKEDAVMNKAHANVKGAATTRTKTQKDALVRQALVHVMNAPTQRKRVLQDLVVVHQISAHAKRLARNKCPISKIVVIERNFQRCSECVPDGLVGFQSPTSFYNRKLFKTNMVSFLFYNLLITSKLSFTQLHHRDAFAISTIFTWNQLSGGTKQQLPPSTDKQVSLATSLYLGLFDDSQ